MNAAKIRCRDLMVGDWIADNNGFQWQITNVGEDYAYATWEGNEGDPWEFDDKYDRPKPILYFYPFHNYSSVSSPTKISSSANGRVLIQSMN